MSGKGGEVLQGIKSIIEDYRNLPNKYHDQDVTDFCNVMQPLLTKETIAGCEKEFQSKVWKKLIKKPFSEPIQWNIVHVFYSTYQLSQKFLNIKLPDNQQNLPLEQKVDLLYDLNSESSKEIDQLRNELIEVKTKLAKKTKKLKQAKEHKKMKENEIQNLRDKVDLLTKKVKEMEPLERTDMKDYEQMKRDVKYLMAMREIPAWIDEARQVVVEEYTARHPLPSSDDRFWYVNLIQMAKSDANVMDELYEIVESCLALKSAEWNGVNAFYSKDVNPYKHDTNETPEVAKGLLQALITCKSYRINEDQTKVLSRMIDKVAASDYYVRKYASLNVNVA